MFTSGGWGWRRSLRFPSWSVSQSGGGWDSLLVPLDVTWGTLISVCLCLSPFLWPSLPVCAHSNCPSILLATSQHYVCLILLSISIACHMHNIIAVPYGSPIGVSPCFYSPVIHIISITARHVSPYATLISPSSNRKPLSDLFTVCFSLSLSFNMAILERDIYWCSLSE